MPDCGITVNQPTGGTPVQGQNYTITVTGNISPNCSIAANKKAEFRWRVGEEDQDAQEKNVELDANGNFELTFDLPIPKDTEGQILEGVCEVECEGCNESTVSRPIVETIDYS